jgi:hypothetical protein
VEERGGAERTDEEEQQQHLECVALSQITQAIPRSPTKKKRSIAVFISYVCLLCLLFLYVCVCASVGRSSSFSGRFLGAAGPAAGGGGEKKDRREAAAGRSRAAASCSLRLSCLSLYSAAPVRLPSPLVRVGGSCGQNKGDRKGSKGWGQGGGGGQCGACVCGKAEPRRRRDRRSRSPRTTQHARCGARVRPPMAPAFPSSWRAPCLQAEPTERERGKKGQKRTTKTRGKRGARQRRARRPSGRPLVFF